MHKGKTSMKSKAGGVLTVLFTLTILTFTGFKFDRFISRKEYQVKSGSRYNKDDVESIIYAKKDGLKFKVGIMDPEFDNDNSPYVEFKLY